MVNHRLVTGDLQDPPQHRPDIICRGAAVRVFLRLLSCLLLLLFLADPVSALNPDRRISQYGHTAWKVRDGHFGGRPGSVTQTRDGYIWVGTDAGLFRFDGVQFLPWSSPHGEQLPSSVITALLGARDGSLWVGTDDGLVHWLNRRVIPYLKGGGRIASILQDVNGDIWITRVRSGGTVAPLCQIRDSGARCYGSEDGVPLPMGGGPLVRDASGNLWIGTDTTLLRWQPGSSHAYKPNALARNSNMDGVSALSVAADGSLWVGMALTGRGLGLQHMVDGALTPFVAPTLNGEMLVVTALLHDPHGSLWVGTVRPGHLQDSRQ